MTSRASSEKMPPEELASRVESLMVQEPNALGSHVLPIVSVPFSFSITGHGRWQMPQSCTVVTINYGLVEPMRVQLHRD